MANSGQQDADGDGAGSACDCEWTDPNDRTPGEVAGLSASRTGSATATLQWSAMAGADSYAVSRGDLSSKAAGYYGTCLSEMVRTTAYDDPQSPAPGHGFFYLVQAQSWDCGLGTLGFASSEHERTNSDPGACHGVASADSLATGETTVYGAVTGSYLDTHGSENLYESIEEVYAGGPPHKNYDRLEQRWTFNVAAGSVKELHVEGYRSATLDGDGFAFEWSSNGTTWNSIPLSSLPTPADDIDRIAALPSNVTGSIQIRVIDTNRTPGVAIYLDTVYIDRLWIRAVP